MRLLAVTLSLLAPLALHAANKDLDAALLRINASANPAAALEPAKYILSHATEAPSMHLFIASMAALANDRLEDAAFLFYAGQLRARFDMARYPPKQSGSESPAVLLGALNQQIGGAVNPAIMREPKAMAAAVKRIEAFKPATPKGYDPGWPHATANAAAGAAQFAENHASFLRQIGGMSTLLSDPEYFAAFKTVQDFNFAPPDQTRDPKRVKAKTAAEAKMKEIEMKKGIEGIFYRK